MLNIFFNLILSFISWRCEYIKYKHILKIINENNNRNGTNSLNSTQHTSKIQKEEKEESFKEENIETIIVCSEENNIKKDYNSSNFQTEEEKDIALYNQLIGKDDYGIPESSSSNFDIIFILLVSLFLVGSYIGTYFLVMSMARNRNRDTAVWLIIAIIGSPVLAIIILLMAGDSNNTDSF